MKRCSPVCALALGLLLACDKTVIVENAAPQASGPVGPAPALDASLPQLDAGLAQADGAVVEADVPFTRAGLLRSIADCALGRYRAFASLARTLSEATRAWVDGPSEERRTAAQTAWRAAMASWQELELFRFGPAGSASEPGGRDLRNAVYFYPDLNNCLVDQQLVSRSYAQGAEGLSVSARGLGALEYLLFYAGSENSCAMVVSINDSGAWAALSADELSRRRREYAATLAEDLRRRADLLVSAWEPEQENFYGRFVQAGIDRQLFASDQDAFNVVDNALYYFDKELKDFKVGLPLGFNPDCQAESCPETIESRFSLASNDNIAANIVGFRLIFQGCGVGYGGLGFDDWLRAAGKADLAERMIGALGDAERTVRSLSRPLEPLLASDRPQVEALYAALKRVSDLLKAELASALNLEPPAAVQGDND